MNPRSFYKLFAATAVALITAVCVWVWTPDHSVGEFFGEPLFPGLIDKLNGVEVVSIEHAGTTKTFMRDGAGGWMLTEADGYPADRDRIRNMLLGLAGLEKAEPKTALPEFYPDLQVEDSTDKNAKSYQVSLMDAEGNAVAALLVGKHNDSLFKNGQGYFVRPPDDARSWLVRGDIDVTGDLRSWLNTRLLPLPVGRIASITFVNGGKTREAVYKRSSPDAPLQAVFLSDGHFIIDPNFVKRMEEALGAFDFDDVAVRPADLNTKTPFSSAMIETFDGLNVYLFLYLNDSRPFAAVAFSAAQDAAQDVKKEAADLENRHNRWLYQMPRETATAVLPFLTVPEPEKKAKPAAAKNAPAASAKKRKKGK